MMPCVVVFVDRFDFAVHVVRLPYDVEHVLPWNRYHTAVAAGDRWHADVELLPQLRPLHANEDVDEDDDNRSVGEPLMPVAVVVAVDAAAVGAGMSLVDFVGWVRYRLMMIFSKNHLLPKFCIVCLMLHIYRYLDLKCKKKNCPVS